MSLSELHNKPVLSGRVDSMFFAIAKIAGNMLYRVQLGQMIRALSYLSDDILADMGLTRSDIPQHAAKLLARD